MPEPVVVWYGRGGAGLGLVVDGRLGQQTLDFGGRAVEGDEVVTERVGADGRFLGRGSVVQGSEGLESASGVEGAVHRLSTVSDGRYWTSVGDRAGVSLNSRWQRTGVGDHAAWMRRAAVVLVVAAAVAAEQRQSALWERRERRCPEPLDSLQAMVD